jgi:HSP20 family molecular chaperone IbpA
MHPELIESMHEQARTIYRIATGADMPEQQLSEADAAAPLEDVTRAFAELEALTRTLPTLAGRVAPFSFTPALDAFVDGDELVVEAAIPGVAREDVVVERNAEVLVISGIRRRGHGSLAAGFSHAEIPYGPFFRAFHIPMPTRGEPGVDLERGLLRVRLKTATPEKQPEEEKSRRRRQHSNERTQQ